MKRLTAICLCLLLLAAWIPPVFGAASDYTDIQGHWAEDYIRRVVAEGLFSGVSETKFDPNGTMTRAMFVTALYRMAALCNNISALYREKEEYEEAEKAALRSLEIIMTMPQYKIEMATSLINLGEVQTRLGKYEEAKGTLEASMTIYELETDGRDPHYAAATAAMGNLYYFWKKPEEAAGYFRRAMELIERDYGKNSFYEMMARNLKTVEDQMKQG